MNENGKVNESSSMNIQDIPESLKVIIIGKGAGMEVAPDGLSAFTIMNEFDVWGVNNVCLTKKVDMVFNMHDLDKHKDHKLFNKTIEYVNEKEIPMVCQKQYERIPTSIKFPIQGCPLRYFTNSIDYMIAYAIFLHAVDIRLFGVNMMEGTEYEKQRPSLNFWLGLALGMGMKVRIHEPTSLMKDSKGLYGYDWDEEDLPHVKAREENK